MSAETPSEEETQPEEGTGAALRVVCEEEAILWNLLISGVSCKQLTKPNLIYQFKIIFYRCSM